MKPPRQIEKQPFELLEEAFHLVRQAGTAALTSYFLGTLPFVLALLYFWSDMSRSAFAEQRLVPGAVVLTALFVWMKLWQSVFCRHLLARLCGEQSPRWSLRALLRTAVYQAILQPAGLFLLPFALLIMVPFGWAYAFFSSATVVNGTDNPDWRASIRRSWHLAMIWPLQNHYAITLLFLFGVFVFANLFTALLGGPYLVKLLLGVESVFTRNALAMVNSTLLTAQVALTYLCLDPMMKATYVLRCFYGESLRTGQDLRADLNSLRGSRAPALAAALLGMLLLLPTASLPAAETAPDSPRAPAPPAPAGPSGLSTEQLERSIDRTIQKREYSWRLPRESTTEAKDDSFLKRLAAQIEKGFDAVRRWIEDLFRRLWPGSSGSSSGGAPFASILEVGIVLLIALLLGAIVWVLIKAFANRPELSTVQAEALPAAPDLNREEVSADELPEDGWQRLARELLARGEWRLALRAFYLASLAQLGQRNLLTLARCKSNHDYERELQRRAHALGELPQIFAANVVAFERVWYGSHPATPELLEGFSSNVERMRGPA